MLLSTAIGELMINFIISWIFLKDYLSQRWSYFLLTPFMLVSSKLQILPGAELNSVGPLWTITVSEFHLLGLYTSNSDTQDTDSKHKELKRIILMATGFGFCCLGLFFFFSLQLSCSELFWFLNSVVQFRSVLPSSTCSAPSAVFALPVKALPQLLKFFTQYWPFLDETLILAWISRRGSTVCRTGCLGESQGCPVPFIWGSSWLYHPVPFVTVSILKPAWIIIQSHPSAPACIPFFQKGLAENKIFLKHHSHLLLPLSFSWSQALLHSVQWFSWTASCNHSQKSDGLHFLISLSWKLWARKVWPQTEFTKPMLLLLFLSCPS